MLLRVVTSIAIAASFVAVCLRGADYVSFRGGLIHAPMVATPKVEPSEPPGRPCDCTTWERRLAEAREERAALEKRWADLDRKVQTLKKEMDDHVAKHGKDVLHRKPRTA